MKTLIRILFLMIFSLTTHLSVTIAQPDIDNNRINRDINIMENVLEELFRTQWSTHGNTVRINSSSFSFGRSNDINGTYLPEFGVIFTIPGRPGFMMLGNTDDDNSLFSFHYADKENGEEVTEESVTNKIVEFLRDYGTTIGQLSDDQKVMVIYKTNRPKSEFFIFHSDEENKKAERQSLPIISVVANASDLKTYRSGNLSDSEFRNRLDINSVNSSEEQAKDLRVMANILKTAFEDTGEQQFRIRGSVDYLALDNYGALFSFDIRYVGQSHFDFSGLHESLHDMRKDLEKARAQIDDFNVDIEVRDSIATKKWEEVQAKRAEEKENIEKAYNQLIKDLKSTIADYGRTLHSLESNQQILVSVALNTHYEEIPERIDLQVRKSILENNSREQAMAEIQVREH